MEVAVETTQGLERRMTVELPEERLTSEIDSRLQSLASTVRVPGFRPGKVPMKVLVKRFGRQVRQEVVGEMVRSSFVDAVETEKLRPAGGPTIDPIRAEQGEGLRYTAVFEVYPEIELAPVESLEVTRLSAEVTDADVARMFDVLREQRRTWSPAERASATGDRLTIDFVGTVDGEEFEGGKQEGFSLDLGSGRMLPDFENGLIGSAAGEERSLDVKFPDDYQSEALAGKLARFAVKVTAVEAPQLPEIDEAFIRTFGVEDGQMDSFRVEVRANMERELAAALAGRAKQAVMDALLARNPLQVPRSLVQDEAHRLLNTRRQELANMGIDPEKLSLTTDRFEAEAERRVQLGLLLAEIVQRSELRADPLKVRAEVERIAGAYEDPSQVINWFYGDPGRLSEIESQVLEAGAVEHILERAQVTEEPSSFDAILNPGQTNPA